MRLGRLSQRWFRTLAVAAGLHAGAGLAQTETKTLAPYTFELEPVLGILLPYDIWGTPGTMSTVGVRSSYVVSAPDGAIEVGLLYHRAGADKAYVVDASWRQEIALDFFQSYFSIGFQYSKWALDTDYDSDGACVPTSCATDSGFHSGIKVGAGLLIPLGPTTPLRLGMVFYNGPQLLLLLEGGIGIRF